MSKTAKYARQFSLSVVCVMLAVLMAAALCSACDVLVIRIPIPRLRRQRGHPQFPLVNPARPASKRASTSWTTAPRMALISKSLGV